MDAGIRGFPHAAPVPRRTPPRFARELRPGVAVLPATLPDLADALELGTPALLRTPALNARVESLFVDARGLLDRPDRAARRRAPARHGRLAARRRSRFLTPAQTTCNYVTLWFRNIASLLSEGDPNGTWQRFIIVTTPQGPNSESGPSSGPANGPTMDNYLHTNPYPNTAAPGQPKECEAGNEDYFQGRQVHRQRAGQPGHDARRPAAEDEREDGE